MPLSVSRKINKTWATQHETSCRGSLCLLLMGYFRALLVYYPDIFWAGLRKPRKTSVTVTGIPVEIRTERLPNTSLEILLLLVGRY
jgi:hypothetical protein